MPSKVVLSEKNLNMKKLEAKKILQFATYHKAQQSLKIYVQLTAVLITYLMTDLHSKSNGIHKVYRLITKYQQNNRFNQHCENHHCK